MYCSLLLLSVLGASIRPLVAFAPARVASIANPPRAAICPLFASSSSSSDSTDLDKTLREELKVQLLASADEFKTIQQDLTGAVAYDKKTENDADNNVKERGYFFKLIRRIIAKIMGKKKKKKKPKSMFIHVADMGTLFYTRRPLLVNRLDASRYAPSPCHSLSQY